ncbi:MAG: hypothetical protein N3D84_00595, partial [Candidatus Woesearchaeota archaeon]|nr:hypothetical protein [Candidatus Woesearchaeota archaeon]
MVRIAVKYASKVLFFVFCLLVFCIGTTISHASLDLEDFEFESEGEDDKVRPTEELKIRFVLSNNGNDTLEDVTVRMWFEEGSEKLEDNNGNTIMYTAELHDIEGSADETIRYSFTIPFGVSDGEKYDVKVEVKAKNLTSNTRETYKYNPGSFKISRNSHELFVNASLDKKEATCGDPINMKITVVNIGTNEEEDVNLTAINKAVGIDVRENIYLNYRVTSDKNIFEKTYPFTIPLNANPGVYEITARASYDDGYKFAYSTKNLTIRPCVGGQQTQQPQPTQNQTPASNGQQAPQGTQTTQPGVQT